MKVRPEEVRGVMSFDRQFDHPMHGPFPAGYVADSVPVVDSSFRDGFGGIVQRPGDHNQPHLPCTEPKPEWPSIEHVGR